MNKDIEKVVREIKSVRDQGQLGVNKTVNAEQVEALECLLGEDYIIQKPAGHGFLNKVSLNITWVNE